ncbi:MAG: MBL fold metallo-hydrolase [Verrucomicrobiales bacterium]|nr:MBL fold metallo-hydrolase [Verrucomicrobiales bacterium]
MKIKLLPSAVGRSARPACAIALLFVAGRVAAQSPPNLSASASAAAGGSQVSLTVRATAGTKIRLESSADLLAWSGHRTLVSTGTNTWLESIAGIPGLRFFRAVEVTDAEALTGDHLATSAGDAVIHPINHASFVLSWNGRMIFNDPVGGAAPYQGLPKADLILVSHSHGDHFHAATLDAVRKDGTWIIAPAAVYASLSTALKALTIPLANGESTNVFGLTVEAVPAYNANHPRGVGNGYVVTLGGRRLYMSGDTGDIPETRALRDIDVAFLCMNVPFTMTVAQAASVTRAFVPRILYPYHYRNQDGTRANLNTLRSQVGTDLAIEIRERAWY